MYNIDFNNPIHIHFIGIGGISMSGLAHILSDRHFTVSGPDNNETALTKELCDAGCKIFYSQTANNITDDIDLVVYTAAISKTNPELAEAVSRGIPTMTRAELLGQIMANYRIAVNVAGTHGKTTTTSMVTEVLMAGECDPTISVGGILDSIGGNIRIGQSDIFVTEACEYTNSFLSFFPTVAVITNIDEDHLDFFSGIDEIIDSFKKYAELTAGKGCVIAAGGDENVKKAFADSTLDVKYYGIGKEFEYHAENLTYKAGFPSFEVWHNDDLMCRLSLRVPGEHNVLNALAVIAVCDVWNTDISLAKIGIEEFSGAHRRFEKKGEFGGAVIIDDYAHHPTEIRATLRSAAEFDYNKLWCIFQPHTYSRTKALWNEFCESFDNVDELIIAPIYAARELPDGVTDSEKLAEDIKKRGIKVRYADSFDKLEQILKNEIRENDLVFTMGAGNIVDIADNLCK